MCLLLFALGFALFTASSSAANQPPFELEYASDFSCPDAPAFSALVQAKLGPSPTTSSAPPSTLARVQVRLRATGSGFAGQLAVHRRDTTDYSRDVSGATCGEVANALAFVLALTLSAKDAVPGPTPAPLPDALPVPLPAALPPAPVVAERRAAASAPLRDRSARPRTWVFAVGAQIGARTGLGPVWTTIGSAFVEARRLHASPFTFALRASFLDGQVVTRKDSHGSTDFTWAAGRFELCPVLFQLFAPLSVSPCVGSHVGRIKAVGTPAAPASRIGVANKLWVDGVATLRVALEFVPWLALEAQGDLLFPLTRYEFGFDDPRASVYSVPGVARAGSVGLAVHFP